MTRRNRSDYEEGFHVLARIEKHQRYDVKKWITTKELYEEYGSELPHLDLQDFEELIGFLKNLGFIYRAAGDFSADFYEITPAGRAQVYRGTQGGGGTRIQLQSEGSHTTYNVGNNASGQFQANINSGSGTMHVHQVNQLSGAELTSVLEKLSALREILSRSPDNEEARGADRQAELIAEHLKSGKTQEVGPRLAIMLQHLALIAALIADGQQAFQIGQHVLKALGGGA